MFERTKNYRSVGWRFALFSAATFNKSNKRVSKNLASEHIYITVQIWKCTLIVLVANMVEDMSFVFFGFPLEALTNFLFLGLLEGVSRAFPFGSTVAKEYGLYWLQFFPCSSGMLAVALPPPLPPLFGPIPSGPTRELLSNRHNFLPSTVNPLQTLSQAWQSPEVPCYIGLQSHWRPRRTSSNMA